MSISIKELEGTQRCTSGTSRAPPSHPSPSIIDENGETVSFASLSTLDTSSQYPKTLHYKRSTEMTSSRIRIPQQQVPPPHPQPPPQACYPSVPSPVMMPSCLGQSTPLSSSMFNFPIINSSTPPATIKHSGSTHVSPQMTPQKEYTYLSQHDLCIENNSSNNNTRRHRHKHHHSRHHHSSHRDKHTKHHHSSHHSHKGSSSEPSSGSSDTDDADREYDITDKRTFNRDDKRAHSQHSHRNHSRSKSSKHREGSTRDSGRKRRNSRDPEESDDTHKRNSTKSCHDSGNHRHSRSRNHSKHKLSDAKSTTRSRSGSNSRLQSQQQSKSNSHNNSARHSLNSSHSSKVSLSPSSATNSTSITPQCISAATSPDFFSERYKTVSHKTGDTHQKTPHQTYQQAAFSVFQHEKHTLRRQASACSILLSRPVQNYHSHPQNTFSPPLIQGPLTNQGFSLSSSGSHHPVVSPPSSYCQQQPPLPPPTSLFLHHYQQQQHNNNNNNINNDRELEQPQQLQMQSQYKSNSSNQHQQPQLKMLLSQIPVQDICKDTSASPTDYTKHAQELDYSTLAFPKIALTTFINGNTGDTGYGSDNCCGIGNTDISIANSNNHAVLGNNTIHIINDIVSSSGDDSDNNIINSATHSSNNTKSDENVSHSVMLPCSGDLVGDDEMPNRYFIQKVLGKGAFSSVFHARDQVLHEDVAIKFIRNDPEFLYATKNEVKILELLNKADPNDDFNIQRAKYNHSNGTKFWFTYKETYTCIVTELLSDSLYNLIEKTSFYGISIQLIRSFAHQILVALTLFTNPHVSVVHCDLKPENILICNPKKLSVKLIDFGSSVCAGGTLYKYAQSRFYRAPEVILRLPYKYPVDMWSLGCILFELHKGVPLFQGRNEGEQIAEFVSYLGLPPEDMIVKSPVAEKYFRPTSNHFSSHYFELVPGLQEKCVPKKLVNALGAYVGGPDGKIFSYSRDEYLSFVDLIERMIVYDPDERITPQQALNHRFFTKK